MSDMRDIRLVGEETDEAGRPMHTTCGCACCGNRHWLKRGATPTTINDLARQWLAGRGDDLTESLILSHFIVWLQRRQSTKEDNHGGD